MNSSPRQPSQNRITRCLIDWFATHARDLPWRRTLNPYAIWVSEIMLQQTQVSTVIPYYDRWMKEAPDVATLAKLSSSKLHNLWEGLGYYTRARNLQKAARQIIDEHSGAFPDDYTHILQLSGIGRYTAGAISSIAFNQPKPIVDGNVVRVLSRFLGIEGNPKDKKIIELFWDASRKLVEAAGRMRSETNPANRQLKFAGNCSMLNQSLMELGATICTPKNPECKDCPIQRNCFAHNNQRVTELPQRPSRAKPTPKKFIAFIISNRNKFYVKQRPDGVVNAHLWELPNVEVDFDAPNSVNEAAAQLGLEHVNTEYVTTVKHSITRYRVTTECYRVLGDQRLTRETEQLMSKVQFRKSPFASAHRRLIDLI